MASKEEVPSTQPADDEHSTPTESSSSSSSQQTPPAVKDVVTDSVIQATINGYKSGFEAVKVVTRSGSSTGDGYLSIMYALDIDLKNEVTSERETLHCMLKAMPRDLHRAEMSNTMNVYRKETAMYQKVFPSLADLQKERGIKAQFYFSGWPTCYAAHNDGSTDYLVMENLKAKGYKMGDRAVGMDYNQCTQVIAHLARFHVLSYVKFGGSREKILEAYPMLKESQFTNENGMGPGYQRHMSRSFKVLADTFRKMGETLVASRLEKMANSLDLTAVMTSITSRHTDATVITHGDCWTNNIMLKCDDSDAKSPHQQEQLDVKFIDFQLSQASSGLIDVYYFILTSARLDVLEKREQDLLRRYFSEFDFYSNVLGVDTAVRGLTWEKFMEEALNCKFYGLFVAIICAPMMTADSEEIPDFQTTGEEESKEAMQNILRNAKDYANKKVIALCKEHLPTCPQAAEFL